MFNICFFLLIGCNRNTLSSAEFTNTKPAVIKTNQTTYILTDNILENNEVGRQIGKIDKVYTIVSYLDEDNPYKNLSGIYQIENIKIEEEIAVQINDKLYRAKIKK